MANAAIVPAGANGAISLFVSGQLHVILDIKWYFAPQGSAIWSELCRRHG